MTKFPKKEDLLIKSQTPSVAITPNKPTEESSGVERAKSNAEIAAQRDKQVESEINTRLREQGYKSLEDGLADVKRKVEEANKTLEAAQKQEQSISDQHEAIEHDKQKVLNAYAIVKDRETKSDARLEEAVRIEKGRQEQAAEYKLLRKEIQSIINYHNSHVVPCVKALRKSIKTIYTLWTVVENPKEYDGETLSEYVTSGLNFVGRQTTVVDKYLDNVKGAEIPLSQGSPEDNTPRSIG